MEGKMDIVQFEKIFFRELSFKLKDILNLAFDLKVADVLILDFLDSDILLDSDLRNLSQRMKNILDVHLSFYRIVVLIEEMKLRYEIGEIHYQILERVLIVLWISVEDDDIFEYCERERVEMKDVEKIKENKLKLWREL